MSRTIDAIAVQFKSSVVEYKIYSASCLVPDIFDAVPKLVEMISKNIFLGGREVVASCRLKRLDLVLGHIDQKREISRISPKAD
jgi:hypothetical protein